MYKRQIDEIKGVYLKLEQLAEPVRVHKAQAMCYAYIFALQHDIERIGIQMTYVNLDTEEIKYFHEDFTFAALEEWFDDLIRAYTVSYTHLRAHETDSYLVCRLLLEKKKISE